MFLQRVLGYEFRLENGRHTAYFSLANEEELYPVPVDAAFATALTDLLRQHGMMAWDGFNQSVSALMDGTSFSVSFSFADGTRVHARGYGAFPPGYSQAASALDDLFLPLLPKELRSEVEKTYRELHSVADSQAKAILMTEYVRFLTDMANWETILDLLHPDQPVQNAQRIPALWENQCVTLCQEANAPAAERKDSLLGMPAATGAACDVCAAQTTHEENGRKATLHTYCPAHSFPSSMTDALLQGQDTPEAWAMVRQIWGVELTGAYGKLSAQLGENAGLASAEYQALTQWMMAREASLMALYPQSPELVAQTMVKLLMERVNQLCQALH